MPPMIWNAATDRQRAAGYGSFSDYVQDIIRRDTIASKFQRAA